MSRPPEDRPPSDRVPITARRRIVAAVVLLAPFVALLWVPAYARTSPELGGVPFFYWYQLLWVFVTAACTATAYLLLCRGQQRRRTLRKGEERR